MGKKARNATIIGIAIGLIAAPFVYKYIRNKRKAHESDDEIFGHSPSIFPAYRGKHKPHHRKNGAN